MNHHVRAGVLLLVLRRAKYPAMDLAYAAGRAGGTMTGVLSAANEQAVAEFLEEKIHYLDIMKLNEACCEAHKAEWVGTPDLEQIVHYDQWARRWVAEKVRSFFVGCLTGTTQRRLVSTGRTTPNAPPPFVPRVRCRWPAARSRAARSWSASELIASERLACLPTFFGAPLHGACAATRSVNA